MKKRLKTGFTLVEVLVVLTVVALLAAVVIPSMIHNTMDKKNGVALGRSVETIETGCQMIIQRANEMSHDGEFVGHYSINKNMDGTEASNATDSISGNNLFTSAPEFFNVKPLSQSQKNDYENNVKSFSGDSPSPSLSSLVDNYVVNTDLGAYYGIKTSETETTSDDPVVALVYIDVTGSNPRNRYGHDIFLFGLTDSCHMIPAGTTRINAISSIPVSSAGCAGTGSVENGLSCTQRVIQDGYHINYKH